MNSINKPLVRLAMAIHAHLGTGSTTASVLDLPKIAWERCKVLTRQIHRAHNRGWNLAVKSLRRELHYAVIDVADQLSVMRERLPRSTLDQRVVSAMDIYEDLLAIQGEFGNLDYSMTDQTLSVTSDAITLEGVYLGPFEIRLNWQQIGGGSSAYRVVASDPHPAEGRDNVTHPHVSDSVLCEGEGTHAIKQALVQGRLLDFFSLVVGMIRTYNSESPYVELALWSGSACSDCGTRVDEEYCYSCERCGNSVCGECEVMCSGCEESCCSNCVGSCSACDEQFCRRCLKICQGCHRRACDGCIDQERCVTCRENDDQDRDDKAASADASIQPDGLGEAAVSA